MSSHKGVSIGIFLFGAVFLVASPGLQVGSPSNPGPGFLPVVVSCLLLLLSGVYVYGAYRGSAGVSPDETGTVPQSIRGWRVAIEIFLCMACYPFLLRATKFLAATALVAVAMMFVLRFPLKTVKMLLFALSISVISFVVFGRLLRIPLPSGPLELLFW